MFAIKLLGRGSPRHSTEKVYHTVASGASINTDFLVLLAYWDVETVLVRFRLRTVCAKSRRIARRM